MGGIKPTPGAYLRRPEWLQKRGGLTAGTTEVRSLLADARLATVCQSARCPNLGECFSGGVATFMILGERCSRHCRFCAVTTGAPEPVDFDEPRRVADAAAQLGLRHIVITSVTRDDLDDGGASHFAATITAIRNRIPTSAVEVLTPDFAGNRDAIAIVAAAKPDVYNHNVETVAPLYPLVRPGADYPRSLDLLATVKKLDRSIVTKSGIMVGFGETTDQIVATLADLRNVDVDLVTIGQYLQPTRKNLPVTEYVTPERFGQIREKGLQLGFAKVEAGPYVRSSYHAAKLFEQHDSSHSIP